MLPLAYARAAVLSPGAAWFPPSLPEVQGPGCCVGGGSLQVGSLRLHISGRSRPRARAWGTESHLVSASRSRRASHLNWGCHLWRRFPIQPQSPADGDPRQTMVDSRSLLGHVACGSSELIFI